LITKFAASSLNGGASLNASALVSKLPASSLTGAGTLAAELTVTGSATLLLDLYPNAAAAYSLRKLRTAYAGSAIRVRRSSDNTEQDIGFVAGNLDTGSLLTFCGVGNGFVTTWYDQSGNSRDASNATAANQPQIVSSGVVLTDGNNIKPAVKFDGTNDELRSGFNIANNLGNRNFYVVHKSPTIPTSLSGIFTASNGHGISYINTQNLVYVDGAVGNPLTQATNYSYIINKKYLTVGIYVNTNSVNSQLFNNDVASTPNTFAYNVDTNSPLSIGGRTTNGTIPNRVFLGNIQECILWYGTLTTRTDIQSNINTYYGIY